MVAKMRSFFRELGPASLQSSIEQRHLSWEPLVTHLEPVDNVIQGVAAAFVEAQAWTLLNGASECVVTALCGCRNGL